MPENREWYQNADSTLALQYAEYLEDDERDLRARDKQYKKGYKRVHKRRDWEEVNGRHMGGGWSKQ